jgi:hypothetical protein
VSDILRGDDDNITRACRRQSLTGEDCIGIEGIGMGGRVPGVKRRLSRREID